MKLKPVAAIACFAFIAADARAAELRIRESATVETNLVRLGDIADVTHRDPKVEAKMKQLVVGPAPPAGQTVRIDFSAIRSHLRSAGIDLSKLRIAGRNNVVVTRSQKRAVVRQASYERGFERRKMAAHSRAEALLSRAIEHHLKRVAKNLGKVDVAVELKPDAAAAVSQAWRADFEFAGFQTPLYRPQSLRVQFTDAKGNRRAVAALCHINNKPYVVAAKYRIPRGEIIQQADLTLRQVESTKYAIERAELVVGMETKRTIQAGAVIQRDDVRRKPLIRRNQIVDVFSRRPGIVIQRRMTSRGEGALGETIKLYDPRTRKTISAEVIGVLRAEVAPNRSRGRAQSASSRQIIFRDAKAERSKASRDVSPRKQQDPFRRFRTQRYDKDRDLTRRQRKPGLRESPSNQN